MIAVLLSIATLASPTQLDADIFAPHKHAVTVLVFVSTDCPIANASAPELNRIAADFAEDDVAFYRVYADGDLSATEIESHGEDFSYTFPAIHDASQVLLRRAGATRVPETAVFDAEGVLVYRGRINNAFADFGKRRRYVTSHDLRDAITAVLDGKPVNNPRTFALGCFISLIETDERAVIRMEEVSDENASQEN